VCGNLPGLVREEAGHPILTWRGMCSDREWVPGWPEDPLKTEAMGNGAETLGKAGLCSL
jgi:hypothetical protein